MIIEKSVQRGQCTTN